ncbi:PREDICTED: ATP-dependent RNA helicase DHX36-like [Eufriesea mexicana]|uniref:ATP-dependent RNA helicase DHX36-like n=1 Tax=Eufriesea mexicana TaxID=516756 RepID=UPI00083C6D1C|nr:PREDICTED: ATP-dependent RNA helicase DHX36-like [Eufriesea mexicana]XP_017752423.1 PREDICTED: ATP-dependent RNA helicase DHX36-like [Eufriesea mexicana]
MYSKGHGGEGSKSNGYRNGQRHSRGPRYPPGLTGKEIGLFYRDMAKRKAATAGVRLINLPEHIKKKIMAVIENFERHYNKLYNDVYTKDIDDTLENKYIHIHDSQFKRRFMKMLSGNIQENISSALMIETKLKRDTNLDAKLLEEYKIKQSLPEYKKMVQFRSKLPSHEKRSEILKLVRENQVVLISGETGCGKTTQIVQYILDDAIEQGNGSITQIICTQPRRISAISVSKRVAAERAENIGTSVGFQVRLEKVLPRRKGSILYCTTGMLLQFVQNSPALKEYSHIVLDEIHERSMETDLILTLLKFIIPKRSDLKVLLMSATLNSERFSEYYDNCPMIHIPGFTYPVQEYYLEDVLKFTEFKFKSEIRKKYSYDSSDSCIEQCINELKGKYPQNILDELMQPCSEIMSLELIQTLIYYICVTQEPGAILVFLPGMSDIVKLYTMLLKSLWYSEDKYVIYLLHSRMPTVEQNLIFEVPPDGIRKIIISTPIAETSITIEDIVYVIDSGKMKYDKFDIAKNIETLKPEWESLANAKQRRGRSGRVKPGICYHLYTKTRERFFQPYPLPEMLRSRLELVILQIKILQLGPVKTFLTNVMDPPNLDIIEISLDLLRKLNALDNEEQLTPLGYHLAQLPLDPRMGKMIIWGVLFSCVQPIFSIAATLSFKDAFFSPFGKQDEAQTRKTELSMYEFSDHIAFYEALRRFEIAYKGGVASMFCQKYFLSFNTLKLLCEMKNQFAEHLCNMKFMKEKNPNAAEVNRNSKNILLIKAIVCAGLYPNIAVITNDSIRGSRAFTPEDGLTVAVHPSSVNCSVIGFPSPYITYFTKRLSTSIYLHDTTCVTVPILLFASADIFRKRKKKNYFSLGNIENLVCTIETVKLIQGLQKQFNNLLEYKISHPDVLCWDSCEGDLMNAIIDLVCLRDKDIKFVNCDNEKYRNNKMDYE